MTYQQVLGNVVLTGLAAMLLALLGMLLIFLWSTRPWKDDDSA